MWKIIYLIRPQPISVRLVAEHVKKIKATVQELDKKKKQNCSMGLFHFHVFILPQGNPLCKTIFEQEGVLEHITFGNGFQFDFVPLDHDLMSLEMEHPHTMFFRDVFLDGDLDNINNIVLSLRTIEDHFGTIPNWIGKGRVAKMVCDLYQGLGTQPSTSTKLIDTIIILDRSCDYVSPLVTPVLYEAVIDSMYKIEMGMTDATHKDLIDYAFVSDSKSSGKILLNNLKRNDPVYEDLRTMDFREVPGHVEQLIKSMKTYLNMDDPHNNPRLAKIEEYLKAMGDFKDLHETLLLHQRISSLIMEHRKNPLVSDFRSGYPLELDIVRNDDAGKLFDAIEDLVLKQEPLFKTLRLFILHHLVNNGVKNSKACMKLQRLFLQQYGFEHLMTFNNLDRLGMIGKVSCFSVEAGLEPYATLSKKLGLKYERIVNPERKEKKRESKNPSVFNGKHVMRHLWKTAAIDKQTGDGNESDESEDEEKFSCFKSVNKISVPYITPLSVALCRKMIQDGSESLKNLSCKNDFVDRSEELARCNYNINLRLLHTEKNASTFLKQEGSMESIMVYFLGGCTFEEIAYLRKLSKEIGKKIIVATTGIIRQDSFMVQFVETISQIYGRC